MKEDNEELPTIIKIPTKTNNITKGKSHHLFLTFKKFHN